MEILLVDDSIDIGEILQTCLQPHRLKQVYSIADARSELGQNNRYDLLIIDISLPDGNGLKFCTELDLENQNIPKVILSASDDVSNKVYGLTSGAVDYITKPFDMSELRARVELQSKRLQQIDKAKHRFGLFEFDQDFCNCFFADENEQQIALDLTPTELRIFLILLRNEGQIVSKQEFIRNIWKNFGINVASRGLDTHIANLRKKIKLFGISITCAWGRGYSLQKKEA